MSYCVNCGVELDATLSACPLCHTKVYHPDHPADTTGPKPYPSTRGVSEPVKRREFTILMTIVCATVSVVCGLLNFLLFSSGAWSLYVIGVCILLWIFLMPAFFPESSNLLLNLTIDGLGLGVYLGCISLLHPGNGWFLQLALPTVILATVALEIFFSIAYAGNSTTIRRSVAFFTLLAIFCVSLEIMIDLYVKESVFLFWSVIVLACCIAIDIVLVTISLQQGLRSEIRKRMHF